MRPWFLLGLATTLLTQCRAARYDPRYEQWNLNVNKTATEVLDYAADWPNHQYHPSPDNWRFPIYTIIVDKWVDGDPRNNDINGTVFEYDFYETGLRNGGDVKGIQDSLDYLQGMGIKGLYISGTPYLNRPWQADQYSPIDFTILDPHQGTIQEWRNCIDELHRRDMYIIFDLTVGTLADLVGFTGYLNTSTTFSLYEHDAEWKTAITYPDFQFNNVWDPTCELPEFWDDDGGPVVIELTGCYASEFDQYGDTEAFGVHPNWQRQLSKFASVQDRLREWDPTVGKKLNHYACLLIAGLDPDAFRLDKATQMTVGFLAEWSKSVRQCAALYNKKNFYIPGEITGGDSYGSIYLGRGRQPDQRPKDWQMAMNLTGLDSEAEYFLRNKTLNALDASAFQYSVYRALTIWFGLEGAITVPYDIRQDFVEGWLDMVQNEDLINANTGKFDPRHMNGMTNHDVLRWPAVENGEQILALGSMITQLVLPGAPSIYYGEEQDLYMLDNTANNYLFGRQSMTSSMAWYIHGCYSLSSQQYPNLPLKKARDGCHDFLNAQDHRDVSAAPRNGLIALHEIRDNYPVAHDGFCLENLGNWSIAGSEVAGLHSVHRFACPGQTFTTGKKNQDLWFLYVNANVSTQWSPSCSAADAMIAPPVTFPPNTVVRNLVYPFDEYTLSAGPNATTGCLPQINIDPYGFKIFVPKPAAIQPRPVITRLSPGHDARIVSTGSATGQTLNYVLEFSNEMSCDSVGKALSINSTTLDGTQPIIGSYVCSLFPFSRAATVVGAPPSVWQINATITNLFEGIHEISIGKAQTQSGNGTTLGFDHALFRIGKADNPLVFPLTSNYTTTAMKKGSGGMLTIEANAAGADLWRYSLDWGTTWSNWTSYGPGLKNMPVTKKWKGSKKQRWQGDHAILQYWSRMAGSSSHQQHADLDGPGDHRSFPHMFIMGPFNEWGYDAGARNQLSLEKSGNWTINFVSEAYPSRLQFNVWGINPDGNPDASWVYGTLENSSVIERVPPSALGSNIFNISTEPRSPHLGWELQLNDLTRRIYLKPKGSYIVAIIIYFLCLFVPPLTALLAALIFKGSFYAVKFNQEGRSNVRNFIPLLPFSKSKKDQDQGFMTDPAINSPGLGTGALGGLGPMTYENGARKTVLIATLEYNIEDWGIKIKIGGLGVMAQLMATNLKHQDLIWVVPCVGDVNYPEGEYHPPMEVKILDQIYQINVSTHIINNITYVLLDAPVFRRQSTIEPYPARMDDLESAIFYSAWNQCIAETARRFPVDLYHINDYHGALAPLYLLPDLMPCALSLHNAEFQGLWPLRTPEERDEVCAVYNISPRLCQKYVQFGNVFNLLHAGVSFLRIHQKGFGAVGVSTKYGKRSWARYPIFWGLKKIGKLPNPDPTDTADIGAPTVKNGKVVPNSQFEENRKHLKRDAQEWAGLRVDPSADLLVFVGRWSMQKGIDLIADIVPTLVEEFNVQVICVGPIIDLYGKFAAEKLARLMEKYPERVYSRPEFTALPPYIFSGADFTLIPSRDEPFGLVAVEFGRKGALGIGARVGGLGQMPGWWYTVESSATTHLLSQFESACRQALSSNDKTRALLRAKSALQRFPVQEWIQKLDALQAGCIKMCKKKTGGNTKNRGSVYSLFPPESSASVSNLGMHQNNSQVNLPPGFTNMPNASSPVISIPDEQRTPEQFQHAHFNAAAPHEPGQPTDPYAAGGANLRRQLSLGSRRGPGHRNEPQTVLPRDVNGELIAIDEEEMFESDQEGDLIHPDQVRGAFRGYGGFGSPSEDGYESEDQFDPQRSTMYEVMDDDSVREGGRGFYGHSNASSSMSLSQMANVPYGRRRSVVGEFASPPQTPPMSPSLGNSQRHLIPRGGNDSRLSLASVMTGSGGKDFSLTKVQERFTDEDGMCLRAFSSELRDLNPKNSKHELCIEEYLIKSEKSFFADIKNEKLGFKPKVKKGEFSRRGSLESSRASSFSGDTHGPQRDLGSPESSYHPHSPLFMDPKTRGIARFMQRTLGEWPIYTIFLAIGQILAATSYQLTLLSSSTSQSAAQLYTIGIVFMFGTVFWWTMYRLLPAVWCLSAPFAFYMVAFFMIGLPGFSALYGARDWINAIGTWFYAVGSASGSLYFALNFGDEGGASTQTWIVRACMVQGTQQIWGSALWYWGEKLTADTSDETLAGATQQTEIAVTGIVLFLAVFMAATGLLLAKGLPDYYRQLPGRIPAFYISLVRRKLVLWFMVATILQNYWLSTLYGRSWRYLWSSPYINTGVIFALVIVFFLIIWGIILYGLAVISKTHSWTIPVVGIGLGAPRWAQMLWATSNIGQAMQWAGQAGPYLGRCLWLWLGVLDAIQGVGIGMLLLQTLTRAHVATTLMAGQMLGAVAMLVGRASAPNAIGPADTFLDFATWTPSEEGAAIFASVSFWLCLFCQIVICIGYLVYFRKEQLSKP
ncbi:cell wall alpha-1,3-glucan synthase ags1 [Protomyces lactucae-debilis]|uniref:alpha-1,3-glucan synthase n=1 Tax=Protomyces lactucae-debilis TaxID=2754530 RepID=A0A1Y2F2T9_PROLT|nr:cell wall alpha-1,3-glucan synthase ags1 [Protomyces lactucae-debilis]ORY78163.1 cell wall alpha-1,3-glucan synthase ags1 [Protomyces lactucae-debilis]